MNTPRSAVSSSPPLSGPLTPVNVPLSLPAHACGTILLMKQISDTQWVIAHAKSLGFDLCGVVRAEKFPELANTSQWLASGYAGEMNYLSDPRRADPQSVMRGVRSIIVCLLNYNTAQPLSTDLRAPRNDGEPRAWISRYSWGDDYHEVLRVRLNALVEALRERVREPFESRAYVDTGPVQERVLAKYAGLGWLGKNTLLLNETLGSFFFLGVILTTLDLEPSVAANELPPPDLCGNCRQCLDACPTQAFVEPYVLDARKCISYLTIELRGSIPEELRGPMGTQVFGCDICQDVCPWNRHAPMTSFQEFQPRTFPESKESQAADSSSGREETFLLPRLEWLASLTEADFRGLFLGSPIKRTKWRGLVRNACIALGNSGLRASAAAHAGSIRLLERLQSSPDQMIAESALWALSRIQR
jgi:epoxyqueuosine reductase